MKFALFTDWIMNNEIDWDATNKLGYGFEQPDQQTYGGSALLTSQSPIFYAIDQGSENGNTADLGSTFSKAEKSMLISAGTTKTQAGTGGGNDVAQLIGAEIGALGIGESVKVAFLVGATTNLIDLQAAVTQAQTRYSDFLNSPPMVLIDTTCFNQTATLTLTSGQTFDYYSDPQGTDLLHSGNDFITGVLTEATTYYIQNTDQIFKTDIRAVRVVPFEAIPEVTFPTELLFLGDNPNNTIQFEDQTFKATNWVWDFDNGTGSTDNNPIAQFNDVGDYQITVDITNKFGCSVQFSKMLSVRERGIPPTFPLYGICPGEALTIASNETNQLRVYSSMEGETPISEGNSFEPEALLSDTTFYISNIDDEFESIKVAVPISVVNLVPDFIFQLDTIDLTNKGLLQLQNTSIGTTSFKWIIDGVVIENDDSPVINITGSVQVNIELEVSNSDGCTISKIVTLTPAISSAPSVGELTTCSGTSVSIEPIGGSFFHFYSDADLTHLVKKGNRLETGLLTNDTTIYVTNVDQLLESEASPVNILVIPSSADFNMAPNPLIVEDGNQVKFSDLSFASSDWHWFINDQLVEVAQHPTLFFDSIGIYEIRLRIFNEQGCTFEKTRMLEVKGVTGLLRDLEDPTKIYPNPTQDRLTIERRRSSNERFIVEIFDLSGKKQLHTELEGQLNSIDTHMLQPGIYSLIIKSKESIENHRIIVQ